MSGDTDKLAQIATRNAQVSSGWPPVYVQLTPAERDALVEIAKAAQELPEVLDELIAWINTDMIGCLEVEERGEAARKAIRAALFALDGDT